MLLLVILLVQLSSCCGYEGSGQSAYGDDEDWSSPRYKVLVSCCSVLVSVLVSCCSVLVSCCPLLVSCCSVLVSVLVSCCSVLVSVLVSCCSLLVSCCPLLVSCCPLLVSVLVSCCSVLVSCCPLLVSCCSVLVSVLVSGTPWCAPIKLKHGDVSCRTPRGEHHRTVMGTRCKIRCKQGYESQSSEVVCMASKHWSSNYACREIRCAKLDMPLNGGYKCSDGSYFNSRCNFFCSPGFSLKGQKTTTCQHTSLWSATVPTCVDLDPPKIKCPTLKDKWAEPRKLTARVTWDTPEGVDTADGILTDVVLKGKPSKWDFPEGLHKMSYTVFDRAGNKGTCRFSVRVRVRRCSPLVPPDNSYMKCDADKDNYGASCEFKCSGGFELQGSAARVCQYGLTWSGSETSCAPMNINVGVRSAAALLDQFYEKRRLLIISAPTAANHNYRFQMTHLQHAQCGLDLRHVSVIELVGTYPAQVGRIRHRLLTPALSLQLRILLRIPQRSFQMVLVDKQGVDKQRYPFPVTAAELFTTIDSFPLRKDEVELQQEAGQSCQS